MFFPPTEINRMLNPGLVSYVLQKNTGCMGSLRLRTCSLYNVDIKPEVKVVLRLSRHSENHLLFTEKFVSHFSYTYVFLRGQYSRCHPNCKPNKCEFNIYL